VPDARVLSIDESTAALRLQTGFEARLVASEPLIEDPVQAVFDAAGHMWVVEMRSYMRDVDGSDELRADGRIRVLFDRDGDGRMDEAKTFLDGLVLPRSVLPLQGGALVIAPPLILWVEDRDGDLVADRSIPVCDGLDSGLANNSSKERCRTSSLKRRIANAGQMKSRITFQLSKMYGMSASLTFICSPP
jgi:hypothetical protein